MNTYKDKYFKYKKKYIYLKFKTIGAGSVDKKQNPQLTSSEKEIINREFNLNLVKNGARLAFLLELSHYPTKEKQDNIVKYIKDNYKDISSFVEYKIKNNPHRILYYLNKNEFEIMSTIKNNINWLALVLGFQCKGIPDEKYKRISSHYIITDNNSNKVNFYSEICIEEKYKVNNQRLKKFQTVADNWKLNIIQSKFKPPYTITHETKVLHNKLSWIELVIQYLKDGNTQILNLEQEFQEEIEGYGLLYLIKAKKKLQYLLNNNSEWVLYTVLRIKIDPLSPLYPFTPEVEEKLEYFEKTYFNKNHDNDPSNMLIDIQNQDFFKLLISDKNKQKDFTSLLVKLNKKYKEYLTILKK